MIDRHPSGLPLVFVVAIAENGVIGRAGGLPWRLKSDLKYFRSVTLHKPILMGRKTYASIGRPLDKRTNIVVTRDRAFTAPGVLVAHDLDAALAAAEGDARRRGAADIAVIGGADLYAQLMPRAARLLVTSVHARPDGDTLFPRIDPAIWRETERRDQPAGPGDDASYTLITYERAG